MNKDLEDYLHQFHDLRITIRRYSEALETRKSTSHLLGDVIDMTPDGLIPISIGADTRLQDNVDDK